MVQRYGEYTYRQGWMRKIVGEERRGKETDRCPLTVLPPSISILPITFLAPLDGVQ
jgi:hypothetical protein